METWDHKNTGRKPSENSSDPLPVPFCPGPQHMPRDEVDTLQGDPTLKVS
jgi:hypothetical protein